MILCLQCPRELKAALDRLVRAGRYADYSEAVACAVENLALLHERIAGSGPLVLEDTRGSERSAPGRTPRIRAVHAGDPPHRRGPLRKNLEVPQIFRREGLDRGLAGVKAAIAPEDTPGPVAAGDWIFGQKNKLLPVKAACRAFARLLLQDPAGVRLRGAAQVIWADALLLGERLRALAAESRGRVDLSAGFPVEGSRSASSGRRFVQHFVGHLRSGGALMGLPADLKLLARVEGTDGRVGLTETGWRFALAENPVLDGGVEHLSFPLGDEEAEILLRHVRESVPREASAFQTILEAVEHGHDTPVRLDAALREGPPARAATASSDRLLLTQRTGAVSRMADLGLLARIRTGRLVRYAITARGRQWRRRFETSLAARAG
jgi:hypothetical protein